MDSVVLYLCPGVTGAQLDSNSNLKMVPVTSHTVGVGPNR